MQLVPARVHRSGQYPCSRQVQPADIVCEVLLVNINLQKKTSPVFQHMSVAATPHDPSVRQQVHRSAVSEPRLSCIDSADIVTAGHSLIANYRGSCFHIGCLCNIFQLLSQTKCALFPRHQPERLSCIDWADNITADKKSNSGSCSHS